MTTPTDPRVAPAWTPAVRQLSAVEARRMLRHPAYAVGLLCIATLAASFGANQEGPTVNQVFLLVYLSVVLIYAPLTFVAANRVSAGTYQRGVREVFDSTPVGARQRTVAVIVGLLQGPVVVGFVGAAVLLVLGEFTIADTVVRTDAVYQRTALEYLQLPALVLGAGLLGIAVARWLPWPGSLPLTTLALWLGTIAMSQLTPTDLVHGRTWFALWPVWAASNQGMLPRQPLGQEMWHLTYLLGLGVLAAIAALVRTQGPRRTLYATAGTVTAMTAAAAWLQLG